MSDETTSKRNNSNRISSIHEQTTSKNEKKRNLQASHFLKNKHPELFEITPLPGGFHRHGESRRNLQNVTETKASETKVSTSSKIKLRNRDHHANIGEILETSVRCPGAGRPVSKDDRKNNTVRMCSIAVSTVMMLAQKTYDNITMEHVRHTQEYFRGLRQPDGYPANVGQLMKLLTHLKKSGKIVASSSDETYDDDDNDDEPNAETKSSDKTS